MTQEQEWNDDKDLAEALKRERPIGLRRKEEHANNACRRAAKHVKMAVQMGIDDLPLVYDHEKAALWEEAQEEINYHFGVIMVMANAGYDYYKRKQAEQREEGGSDDGRTEGAEPETADGGGPARPSA